MAPYTTAVMLGGTSAAMVEAAAMIAATNAHARADEAQASAGRLARLSARATAA
jgi:hypothetical protein